MGEFCLGKNVRNLPEYYEKVLFYETYLEERNINLKRLICSLDKKITKFGKKKKMGEFCFG